MKTANSPILVYGLLTGLLICVFSVVLYIAGAEAFFDYGWVNYLILIIVPTVGAILTRKANDGYLPFSKALKTVFGIMVVALLMQVIFNYVLLNFVDESFSQAVSQLALDKSEAMMKRFNMPQDDIDKAMDEAMKNNTNSLKNLLLGFAIWCIPSFLISMIIAAIVKRNKPEFENTFTEL